MENLRSSLGEGNVLSIPRKSLVSLEYLVLFKSE
jgi:hypothetical protein